MASRKVTVKPREPRPRLSRQEIAFLVRCDVAQLRDLEEGRASAAELRLWAATKRSAALNVARWLGGNDNVVNINKGRR